MDVSVQLGRRYRFKLADVICPDRREAVQQISTQLEVCGQAVLVSDGGHDPERFAVMEVEGISSPLIIPVERLRPSWEEGKGQEAEFSAVSSLGNA